MWGLNNIDLFDWDEINFAEIAREMCLTGNYLQPTIDFQPFHEKPPLFAWLQLIAFRSLGVSELAARLPNLICGGLSLISLYWFGNRRQPGLGIWWAAFLGGSVLPSLYFRSGIIDPWFNLLILLSLLPILPRRPLRLSHLLVSGLLLGLAVMTKGPAAGLIAGLVWLTLLTGRKEWRSLRPLTYLAIGLIALLPAAVWIYFLWRTDAGFFARNFLDYQLRLFAREDAGHGGFPGYHAVVLLLGCFPASIFALPALLNRRDFASDYDRGMRTLFWVVLILFTIVNTKIVHYSSLCYFPLAWFAARWVTRDPARVGEKQRWLRPVRWIWGLYALVTALAVVAGWTLDHWLPLIKNPELASRLSMPVSWPWYAALPTLSILLALLTERWWAVSYRKSVIGHLCLAFVFALVAAAVFAPRIQRYSQGAATDFYKDLVGKDIYVGTAYYKSYAQFFYRAGPPERGGRPRQWRFHEDIDRPLYFTSPLRRTEQVLREVPDAELLYQRGGFSFYRRN